MSERGVEFKGVAVMTVLKVLAVLESTLPSFCLSNKIQHSEATVAVLAVLAASVVMGGFGCDGYPPQTQPSFSPTVPEGHKHRVTTPEEPRKIPRTPAERRRRTLEETPPQFGTIRLPDPKDPAVLKTLRVVNHYSGSNSLPR